MRMAPSNTTPILCLFLFLALVEKSSGPLPPFDAAKSLVEKSSGSSPLNQSDLFVHAIFPNGTIYGVGQALHLNGEAFSSFFAISDAVSINYAFQRINESDGRFVTHPWESNEGTVGRAISFVKADAALGMILFCPLFIEEHAFRHPCYSAFLSPCALFNTKHLLLLRLLEFFSVRNESELEAFFSTITPFHGFSATVAEFEGTVVAHGANPGFVGKTFPEILADVYIQSITGEELFLQMRTASLNGEWLEHIWSDNALSLPVKRLTLLQHVALFGKDWFVGVAFDERAMPAIPLCSAAYVLACAFHQNYASIGSVLPGLISRCGSDGSIEAAVSWFNDRHTQFSEYGGFVPVVFWGDTGRDVVTGQVVATDLARIDLAVKNMVLGKLNQSAISIFSRVCESADGRSLVVGAPFLLRPAPLQPGCSATSGLPCAQLAVESLVTYAKSYAQTAPDSWRSLDLLYSKDHFFLTVIHDNNTILRTSDPDLMGLKTLEEGVLAKNLTSETLGSLSAKCAEALLSEESGWLPIQWNDGTSRFLTGPTRAVAFAESVLSLEPGIDYLSEFLILGGFFQVMGYHSLPCSAEFAAPCSFESAMALVSLVRSFLLTVTDADHFQDMIDTLNNADNDISVLPGGFSVSVTSFEGVVVADPSTDAADPSLARVAPLESTQGQDLFREFTTMANRGGGFASYSKISESTYVSESYISYVMAVTVLRQQFLLMCSFRDTTVEAVPASSSAMSFPGQENLWAATGAAMSSLVGCSSLQELWDRVKQFNSAPDDGTSFLPRVWWRGEDGILFYTNFTDLTPPPEAKVDARYSSGDGESFSDVLAHGLVHRRRWFQFSENASDAPVAHFGVFLPLFVHGQSLIVHTALVDGTTPFLERGCSPSSNEPCSQVALERLIAHVSAHLLAASHDLEDSIAQFSPFCGQHGFSAAILNATGTIVAHGMDSSFVGKHISTVAGDDAFFSHVVAAGNAIGANGWGGGWMEGIRGDSAYPVLGRVKSLLSPPFGSLYVLAGVSHRRRPASSRCSAAFNSPCSFNNVKSLVGDVRSSMLLCRSESELQALFDRYNKDPSSIQLGDSFYAFVFSFDGPAVVHPVASYVGLSLTQIFGELRITSVEGGDVHKNFIEAASEEWGFSDEFPWSTDSAEIPRAKIAFVMRASLFGSSYIIGSGFGVQYQMEYSAGSEHLALASIDSAEHSVGNLMSQLVQTSSLAEIEGIVMSLTTSNLFVFDLETLLFVHNDSLPASASGSYSKPDNSKKLAPRLTGSFADVMCIWNTAGACISAEEAFAAVPPHRGRWYRGRLKMSTDESTVYLYQLVHLRRVFAVGAVRDDPGDTITISPDCNFEVNSLCSHQNALQLMPTSVLSCNLGLSMDKIARVHQGYITFVLDSAVRMLAFGNITFAGGVSLETFFANRRIAAAASDIRDAIDAAGKSVHEGWVAFPVRNSRSESALMVTLIRSCEYGEDYLLVGGGYLLQTPSVPTNCSSMFNHSCSLLAVDALSSFVLSKLRLSPDTKAFEATLDAITHDNSTFQVGHDFRAIVFRFDGECIANGEDPSLVGSTMEEIARSFDAVTLPASLHKTLAGIALKDNHGWLRHNWQRGSTREVRWTRVSFLSHLGVGHYILVSYADVVPPPSCENCPPHSSCSLKPFCSCDDQYLDISSSSSAGPFCQPLYKTIYPDVRVVFATYVLSISGIVATVLVGALLFERRQAKLVKLSSFLFSELVLVGILLMFGCSMVYIQRVSDSLCVARLIASMLSSTWVLCALFAKLWRIRRILTDRSFKRLSLNNFSLSWLALKLLFPALVVTATYLVIALPERTVWKEKYVLGTVNNRAVDQCTGSALLTTLHVLYVASLIAWGTRQAILARNAPVGANETRPVFFSMIAFMVYMVVIFPIQFLAMDSPTIVALVRGSFYSCCGLILLFSLYTQRVYWLLTGRGEDWMDNEIDMGGICDSGSNSLLEPTIVQEEVDLEVDLYSATLRKHRNGGVLGLGRFGVSKVYPGTPDSDNPPEIVTITKRQRVYEESQENTPETAKKTFSPQDSPSTPSSPEPSAVHFPSTICEARGSTPPSMGEEDPGSYVGSRELSAIDEETSKGGSMSGARRFSSDNESGIVW